MSLPFSLYGPLGGSGSPATLQGSVVAFAAMPTAIIASDPAFGVVGSVVTLNGRGSIEPNGKPLAYTWAFQSVPIGSKVQIEGFKVVDTETDPAAPVVGSPSVVSFSPDIVGEYVVSLVVSNGVQDSFLVTQVVSIRAIMVPHGRGLVPDGKFIWSYIRDVWTQVEDKEWFETLWSALIQIVGADMLNLYQLDYNKSIRDIQDKVQRRWLAYEPKLQLAPDDVSFFLDYQQAGNNASTQTAWLRLTSTATSSGSVALPTVNPVAAGRVIVLGGRALKLTRQHADSLNGVNFTLATTDVTDIPTGLSGLNWRIPHTLISKNHNFDNLGVAPGDLLMLELSVLGTQLTVDVPAQVVGVVGDRLGFVLTDQPVVSGVVASIPNKTYLAIASALGISSVTQNPDQSLSFSGLANLLNTDMKSGTFKTKYFNQELTPTSVLQSGGLSFAIRPKHIIRNRFVPVDVGLLSVPLLQEYIKPPDVGQTQWLSENVDYVVSTEIAADENLTFKTGTSIIEADTADFVDRNLLAGDTFTIVTPTSLAGDYPIKSVLSPSRLQLATPVPLYTLGQYVTARVRLKRRKIGNFLRFVPGRFSAASPAPARLWGEVSFFNNNQTIEDNFGILVGLKKQDLDNITTNVSYRQAVTGLMYALTRGSAVSKIELGVKILLGLPFSEHRGIIRSIEGNYRVSGNGTPILGRLLVEDIDDSSNPLGTMRVYTYPIDVANTDLSGIDINPATSKAYAVGDTVEKLSSLSKGVQIVDYKNTPLAAGSLQQMLQQFHSFQVKINANVFTTDEFVLVSDFLKKITPSYVAHVLPVVKAIVETPTVTDAVTKKLAAAMVDNPAMSLSHAVSLNRHTKEGVPTCRIGDRFYQVRRYGRDLVTTAGGFTATSAAGGFLNPKTNERFDGNRCQPGDKLVIFDGPNQDIYPISSLADGSLSTYTAGDLRNLLFLWHLDEASGGGATDATGRLSMALNGTAPAVTGLFNGGRAVSNSNCFSATLASPGMLDAVLQNGAWTVKLAFWIDPTVGTAFPGNGNGNGTILSFGASRFLIGLANNSGYRYYNGANGDCKTGSWTSLSKGVWHRLAVRSTPIGGSKALIDFFVDGVKVGESLTVALPTSFPASPGVNIGGEGVAFDCFKGQLDEIEMWMYPQTEEEIRIGGKPFADGSSQNFAILRPITGLLKSGVATVTSSNAQVVLGAGCRTDGIGPGDWLIFDSSSAAQRYTIISVDSNAGIYDRVTVTPTPAFTGTPNYRVVRRTILDSDELFGISSAGTSSFTTGANFANWLFLRGMLETGDRIQVQRGDLWSPTVIDPVGATITETFGSANYLVKLLKKKRPKTSIGFDHLATSAPDDAVSLTIAYTGAANATCTAASSSVAIPAGVDPSTYGARPGDFLVLVGGTNGGVDVGYGPGVYPIRSLSSGAVVLTKNLTASETLQWKVMRIR